MAEDIARGRISPGDLLPREVDLAARHRVSRGVARECLRALEERGLVAVTHGRGARVTPPTEWNALDPVVLAALVGTGAGERARAEALACLRLLEGEAARLAAEGASAAQVAAIAAAVEAEETDRVFADAVAAASGNLVLARFIRSLQRALDEDVARSATAQARILEAIARGDGGAARAAMAGRRATVYALSAAP